MSETVQTIRMIHLPCFDRKHHFGKQARDIDTESHVSKDLFDNVTLPLWMALGGEAPQKIAKLIDLALSGFGKVAIRNGCTRSSRLLRSVLSLTRRIRSSHYE